MAIYKIDGNGMLHTIVDPKIKTKIPNDFSKPFFFIDSNPVMKNDAKVYYKNLLLTYMRDSLKYFKDSIDVVFFVTDSSSNWRKDFFVNQLALFESRSDWYLHNNLGYKGHRDKSSDDAVQIKLTINYLINDVLPEIERSIDGFYHICINNAEGDDVLALLQEYYTGTNCAMWAKDSDLMQMLDDRTVMVKNSGGKGKNHSIVHTSKLKLSNSLWYGKQNFIGCASSCVLANGFDDVEVDVVKELFAKILCGDVKSDNIPPIMIKETVNGAKVNFSYAKCAIPVYNKVVEKYGTDNILSLLTSFNKEFVDDITGWCIEVFMFDLVNDDAMLKEVKKNIQVNIKLIRLSSKLMPKEIIDEFKGKIIEVESNRKLFDYYKLCEIVK